MVGSVLDAGDEIFVKVAPGDWSVHVIDRYVDGLEMDVILEAHSDTIEVLVKPSGVEVLGKLPSGSVVTAGEVWVAIKYGEDWRIGGMAGWFDSSAVAEMLGDFEVVRRGDEA